MIGAVFILGTLVGSFLNVVMYRLPRGEGFVWGHSRCPHCRRSLQWYELVPLVSYLAIRGRCRTCNVRLSLQYPVVELISGIFFALTFILFSQNVGQWIFSLLILELLLVMAVIDLQHFIIPDSIVVLLAVSGITYHAVTDSLTWELFATAAAAALFFLIIWMASHGRWMGFGDVKLMGALGLVFGFPDTFIILYGAIIGGGIFSIFLLLLRKAHMKTALPFGMLVAVAAGIYIFFEPHILHAISTIFPL